MKIALCARTGSMHTVGVQLKKNIINSSYSWYFFLFEHLYNVIHFLSGKKVQFICQDLCVLMLVFNLNEVTMMKRDRVKEATIKNHLTFCHLSCVFFLFISKTEIVLEKKGVIWNGAFHHFKCGKFVHRDRETSFNSITIVHKL